MHKVNFNNLDQDLYSFTLKNNLMDAIVEEKM